MYKQLEEPSIEAGVLAAVLRNILKPEEFDKYIRTDAVFTQNEYRTIGKSIKTLIAAGNKITPIEIVRICKIEDQKTNWSSIISEIKGVVVPSNPINSALFLSELSARRFMFFEARKLMNLVSDLGTDVFATVADNKKRTDHFLDKLTSLQGRTIADVRKDFLQQRKDVMLGKTPPGYLTHIYGLDSVLKGLTLGEVIIIAARASMGKTAFSCQLAINFSVYGGVPTAFYSLEMSDVRIFTRFAAIVSGYSNSEIKEMKAVNYEYLEKVTQPIEDAPLVIREGAMTINEVEAETRSLVNTMGLKVLFIDYLQLIETDTKGSREVQVSEISRRIKKLADKLKIIIFPLAQLSRGLENQADKRPNLRDLRESGSIEQDADRVIMLYSPSYYATPSNPIPPELKNNLEGWVRKNRDGFTTSEKPVEFNYEKETNRVWNWAEACSMAQPPGRTYENPNQENLEFNKKDSNNLPF